MTKRCSIVQSDSFPLGFGYQVENGAFNRLLDRTADQATGQLAAVEPAADPALTVKVRVTENVAAGSTGDPNLRQQLGVQGGTLARTSPAAGLDIVTGRLFLFYASNQQGLKGSPAQPLRFDIFGAGIPFDSTLGSFPFDPVPLQGNTWTNLGQVSDQPVTERRGREEHEAVLRAGPAAGHGGCRAGRATSSGMRSRPRDRERRRRGSFTGA